MPRHAEFNANTFLGDLLRPMLGKDTTLAQNSQTIVDHPGRQPDLLITAPGRSAVVVEAEYTPAANVEQEAKDRLGHAVTMHPLPIEAALALRYPVGLDDAPDLRAAVRDARFSYCVFTVEGYRETPEQKVKKTARFPESGWLEGGLTDLADLIRLAALPQLAVNTAADALQGSIDRAVLFLNELETLRPAFNQRIARLLGMDNVPQTRRMAGAILSNALVFHQRVAGIHGDIKSLSEVCGPGVANPKADTLAAWDAILQINYHPIFDIARRILTILAPRTAAAILHTLKYTAEKVDSTGVENSHDLTGRVFQRLIADRKYLATFYTLPASAALLARLAVAKLENVDWSDAAAVGQLRIGDFACGTGALLSAVYDQLAARHERAGGDLTQLHPAMMAEALYGCDVLPSAVHITGSTLAGAQPNVGFGQSRLYTMPYGRLNDGSVAIGSLEFLNSDEQVTLSNFSDPSTRTGSAGDARAEQVVAEIRDESFDLVIMNPPFTRAGSDWEGSSREEDTIKQFRGLSTDAETQREMADREKRFAADTCAHGYAGIASSFAALAHRKLKEDGVLALVLPLAAAAGASWQRFRQMLAEHYTDLSVVSITSGGRSVSFSADTAIAECLVIARKLRKGESPDARVQFISLTRRPLHFANAAATAVNILSAGPIRRLEDGPYDGTDLEVGQELVGKALTAAGSAAGEAWAGVRIADYSLAQTAYALADSRLWLPGHPAALALPMAPLNQVGSRGIHDRNIEGGPTAPFTRTRPSSTATYPALWHHDARKETRMICRPDSQLQVKLGRENRAAEVWATASRSHLTRDFTLGSQPLGAAFTERETVGGRAWPSVKFADSRFDYAFALWCNSTLGLLSFWWHSGRQQPGRSIITISKTETLPILDFRALTDDQLTLAQEIFEEFRDKELWPAYLADADPNRALLDQRVICDLLGFDAAVYQGVRRLAEKWCAEPSVHGGKARPREARLVV